MLVTKQPIILAFLQAPGEAVAYDNAQWSLLLRTAEACKISAQLAWLIDQHHLNHLIPEKVQNHFSAARKIANFRCRQITWELNRLQLALAGFADDVLILKGGAYLLLELPFAKARLLSDVDIMVPKQALETIEQLLLSQNWRSVKVNDYDQQYYRQWMHEIPPLRHALRSIEVDIHHTIIPPVSRLRPDPGLLFREAVSVPGEDVFKVLAPGDMLLHSAVHLFYDSDLSNKLRDLLDLDQLIRYFSAQNPDFLSEVLARAAVLGLQRPLYYALRYCQRFLHTPLGGELKQDVTAIAPPFVSRWLMDFLVPLALLPEHPDEKSRLVGFARWLLYVRSHYLRMPLRLLLPHLLRKSWFNYLAAKENVPE